MLALAWFRDKAHRPMKDADLLIESCGEFTDRGPMVAEETFKEVDYILSLEMCCNVRQSDC